MLARNTQHHSIATITLSDREDETRSLLALLGNADLSEKDDVIRSVIQDWDENCKGKSDVLIDALRTYRDNIEASQEASQEKSTLRFDVFLNQLSTEQFEIIYRYCKENQSKEVGNQSLAYEMVSRREKIREILDNRHRHNHKTLSLLPDEMWMMIGSQLNLPTASFASACSFFGNRSKAIRYEISKNVKDYFAEARFDEVKTTWECTFIRTMKIGSNTFMGFTTEEMYVVKVNDDSFRERQYSADLMKKLSFVPKEETTNSLRPITVVSSSSIAFSEQNKIYIWDWQKDECINVIENDTPIKALAMSLRGELVWVDAEGNISFYELNHNRLVHGFHFAYWTVNALLFSNDEKIILMGIGMKQCLQIYTREGELLYNMSLSDTASVENAMHDEEHPHYNLSVNTFFAHLKGCLLDHNRLAIFRGYELAILDLSSFNVVSSLQFPYQEKDPIRDIWQLPSSDEMLLIEKDNIAYVFNAKAGRLYKSNSFDVSHNLSCSQFLDNGDLLLFSLEGLMVCRFPSLSDTLKLMDAEKEKAENRPK